MNELALFAGAGGGILGSKLLGWNTVCAVEIEKYPASILLARQNDGILPPFPVWDDIRTFDGRPWRGIVDVVSGGFPCQDISVAGKKAGIMGDRSGLWQEMARVIGEVRPRFVHIENSPMLTRLGLATVLHSLAALGFDAEWGVISAKDCEAPHKRERIWIVATNTDSQRCNNGGDYRQGRHLLHDQDRDAAQSKSERQGWFGGLGSVGEDVANPSSTGLQGGEEARDDGKNREKPEHKQLAGCGGVPVGRDCQKLAYTDCVRSHSAQDQQVLGGKRAYELCVEQSRSNGCRKWPLEPAVGRVANGVAARVDRLKALGNGQVPRVAAAAFAILAEQLMTANQKLRGERNE